MAPPRAAFPAQAADATATGPGPGPQRPLLDRLWDTLTAPDVHAQLKSGRMKSGDLDAAVEYYTNGQLKSFADLAATRERMQRTATQQDIARMQTPSRGLAYGAGVANELALGLPEKLAPYSGTNSYARQFTDILNRGREAYPRTEPVAELAGAAGPAALAGGAVEEAAAPLLSRTLGRLPGLGTSLGKMVTRGATAGAATGAATEYAQQPNLAPDWKRMGTAAAAGVPFGAAAAVPAWWAATKLNPMEHVASRAVMESAPGDTPSMAAGEAALRTGTTSPMPIGRPGPEETVFRAHPEGVNAALPEPLQQMNFEKSAKLRVEGAKFLAADPEAMNMARTALTKKIEDLREAVRGIETGYEPALKGRPLADADVAALPTESQRAMNALQSPTARDLFKRYRSLRDKASAIFDANESGTLSESSRLDDAHNMKVEAQAVRQWLGDNVPTFNDLQASTGKYLQRLDEVNIARRQIVGRAIKPLGKATDVPAGEAKEGYKELMGFTPRLISSRAARRLAPVLLSPDLKVLLRAAKHPDLSEVVPNLIRSIPALAGVAGPGARDIGEALTDQLPR